MPRTTYADPDPDDGDDDEYDPEADAAFSEFAADESPDVPCPYCGKIISEDHLRCPHCESFFSKEDAPPERKSPFVMIMLIVSLIAVIVLWVMR
jgi:predicted nucleic acid-binding Zn ribbon protein